MRPPERRPKYCVGIAAMLAAGLANAEMGMGDNQPQMYLSVDRAEAQFRDGDDARLWDAEAWFGGDLNKAWFKSQGDHLSGEGIDKAELQTLFSRAVAPFWDLQVGLRHDFRPNPSKTYLVAGAEGLAPYRVDVDAAAFLSEDGDASARLELGYDLRLTQRWILRPRMEVDAAFSQVSELLVGAGPSKLETGLRLRYAIRPEFAPYLGLHYESALGNTRGLRRGAGEERSSWGLVAGLRAWF